MISLDAVLTDLRTAGTAIGDIVTGPPNVDWAMRISAPGWTTHQIARLPWINDLAALAADPGGHVAAGAQANAWLDVAQAFAGPPGGGWTAGHFT